MIARTAASPEQLRARELRFKREAKAGPPPLPTHRMTVAGGKVTKSDATACLRKLKTRLDAQGLPYTPAQQEAMLAAGILTESASSQRANAPPARTQPPAARRDGVDAPRAQQGGQQGGPQRENHRDHSERGAKVKGGGTVAGSVSAHRADGLRTGEKRESEKDKEHRLREKKVKSVSKKIHECEMLEDKMRRGEALEVNQVHKVRMKGELKSQLAALSIA